MSQYKKLTCAVSISGYAVLVRLGVGKEERAEMQKILIDINLRYPDLPQGCESDDIRDVICYDELCDKIRSLIEHKEFMLIEHVAFLIYKHLKSCYLNYSLNIKITKFPRIENLEGCATFIIAE